MEPVLIMTEAQYRNQRTFRAIYTWALIFLICSVITGLFNLFNSYKLIQMLPTIPGRVPMSFKVQYWANIISLVFYGVMLPMQAYFFYLFASKGKGSSESGNEEEFSQSLRLLLIQTVVAALFFMLNAAWAIVNILFFSPGNA